MCDFYKLVTCLACDTFRCVTSTHLWHASSVTHSYVYWFMTCIVRDTHLLIRDMSHSWHRAGTAWHSHACDIICDMPHSWQTHMCDICLCVPCLIRDTFICVMSAHSWYTWCVTHAHLLIRDMPYSLCVFVVCSLCVRCVFVVCSLCVRCVCSRCEYGYTCICSCMTSFMTFLVWHVLIRDMPYSVCVPGASMAIALDRALVSDACYYLLVALYEILHI